jgi:hypothetical protein
MPISIKNKLIFIHIPKTAGSSILDKMVEYDSNTILQCGNVENKDVYIGNCDYHRLHYTYNEIKELCLIINLDISEYEIFTIVRNPYYRFLSALIYNCKDNKNLLYNIENILDKIIDNNFTVSHKIQCVCNGTKFYDFKVKDDVFSIERKHLMLQTDFITGNQNTVSKDIKILKFENLELDIKNNNLNLLSGLKQVNKGFFSNYNDFLTRGIKNKIYEIYKSDFINFNYSK